MIGVFKMLFIILDIVVYLIVDMEKLDLIVIDVYNYLLFMNYLVIKYVIII